MERVNENQYEAKIWATRHRFVLHKEWETEPRTTLLMAFQPNNSG
jgi:hypothetical protein